MKKLIAMIFAMLALLLISQDTKAATCTSISRTNISANSVLTSTEYNGSLNTVYSAVNSLDLGCASSGSLDDEATFDSTVFAALLNGVKEGCNLSASDSNTISVDRCMVAVNGKFVRTTTATTVTWGCTDCSSETASTIYYVYAKTGSSGSTLNLLISTSGPNGDGYDGSGNRLLGQFTNNFSSDIDTVLNAISGDKVEKNWFVDVNISGGNPSAGTNNVATFTELTDSTLTLTANSGSVETYIPCSTTNAPSGLNCSTGDESVGISFVAPHTGDIIICAGISWDANLATASTATITLELKETPNNAQTISASGNKTYQDRLVNVSATTAFTLGYAQNVCGRFNIGSTGQKTFRLMYRQQVTAGTINSSTLLADGVLEREVNITAHPIKN